MALKNLQPLSVEGIPNLDCRVPTADSHQLSLGVESHTVDRTVPPLGFQSGLERAVTAVPDFD